MPTNEEFGVKVVSTFDPKGTDAAAAGLNKVAKSTGEASAESRTLTQDLTSLGSRQNATKDVLEGLDAALKGNANSMFGVAKGAKNLWEIFTASTPAGRALQLALIAVGAAAQFMGRETTGAGESAQATSKDLEAMREAAEAFNKVRFDTLNAQLDTLKAKSDSTLGFFKRLAELSKQLDDASMSLEIARLNADESLSPEAKKAGELNIRDRYARRALERDEGLRGTELTELRKTATGTRNIADAAEAQRAMDAFLVGGIEGNRTRLSQQADALLAEFAKKSQAMGRDQAAQLRISEEFQAARKPLLAEADMFFNPTAEAQLKTYKERLKASTADAEAKAKLAAEAERKLADAERLAPLEQRTGRDLAELSSRERYTAAGVDLPSIRRPGVSDRPTVGTILTDAKTVLTMAREQGKTTGEIMAEMVAAAMRENNDAMIKSFEIKLHRVQN